MNKVYCEDCAKTIEKMEDMICSKCGVDKPKSKFRVRRTYCKDCGNQYSRDWRNRIGNEHDNKFHKEHKVSSKWLDVTCSVCGVAFSKRVSEIKKMKPGAVHCCSKECRYKHTSKLLGGDGTFVVGGKYNKIKKYGRLWYKQKKLCLERDDYTCQCCGDTKLLEVHHWEPYSISFDNSLDNLVVLCKSCHQEKHREYVREGFYEEESA